MAVALLAQLQPSPASGGPSGDDRVRRANFELYDELQRELGFEMHEGGLTFVVRDPRRIDECVGLLDDATRAGYPANAQVVGPSELTDFEPALLPTLAGAVHLANGNMCVRRISPEARGPPP